MKKWAGSERIGLPPIGVEAKDIYSYGRQNWFALVGHEHRACREAVALFDESSFAKFSLVGKDAERALQWICANDIAKPIGSLIYTQMLNGRGGIECDLTVARIATDEFYIVTGTGFATHDFSWIKRNIPDDCDARLTDVTSSSAVLALMGPRARDVLSKATDADVGNHAFPFATLQKFCYRRCAGTRAARDLCGRVGLGIARADRVRFAPVRRANSSWRGSWNKARRLSRD